jgi:capsid portal protein
LISEDQVFIPERREFDEVINFTLMTDMGVKYHNFYTIGPRLMEGDDQIDAFGKLSRAGALSINDGVRIANRVLDMDLVEYEGEWAKIPVATLLELIKKQQVTEIEGVGNANPEEVKKASEQFMELKSNNGFDDISDAIDGMQDTLDQMYSLLTRME